MRLLNTLTRTVDALEPADDGTVGLYVCGPTVQGPPHFGHARAAIVPDVLRRYLEWRGVRVLHVRNITDIDDKIIARAHEEGVSAAELAEHYARVWDHEITRLNVLPPHIRPLATGHVIEMVGLIADLIERGAAYEAGGDVFFAVRSFAGYGKLSGRRPDELRAGARVAADERKRDPLDFALWKAAKPGEPSWPSPWGDGRPGWHIECSAMSTKYLGSGFSIHAGGSDLMFPHHENEIAQWEAATGTPFARLWLHNGLLTLGTEKMSKSIGNIISLSEAIGRYGADTLRMFYLRADYRSPVEFSEERLADAAAGVDRVTAFLRAAVGGSASGAPEAVGTNGPAASADSATSAAPPQFATADAQAGGPVAAARHAFVEAMEDDLSTPRAHAALFDLVSTGNRALQQGDRSTADAVHDGVRELARVLGYRLDTDAPSGERALIDGLVGELLELRSAARAQRDFATADRIRTRLGELGVVVEDTADGARWHVGR